ncbi:hypothetical protein AKJ09_00656 [Labilithrix luteola]|uniref:Lipoprotein n=1 Tax=Labilithrix luteola TaxID=1391654 RepID=A0A0K1PKE6_9BACT|nr:hypothetical protein [Labilithrix luteola]AKU93992.1 hypothetical protein AKJ09_00656 [Labilithrix luteola]
MRLAPASLLIRGSFALALACAVTLPACATYRDQLARSQVAFEQNDHERALALLRNMEIDLTRLTPSERAHYAYLRGMTDYRMGYRVDARHWLALAKAYEEASPGVLPADWRARTSEALEEMNGIVQEGGLKALAASQRPGEASDTARPSN